MTGVREFGTLVLAMALVLPSLGSTVPSFYRRTAALLEEVRSLAGGGAAVQAEDVRDPLDPGGKSLLVATVRARDVPPRARMLVVAGEHARELIGSEVALAALRDAAGLGGGAAASEWRALLEAGLELTVVPVANVEGRELAETVRPCQRGTADVPLLATDLNRNFPTDWTPGVQYNYLNSSLDFHGNQPFSAYQARVIKSVAERHQWDAFVDLHSGSLSLNTPYGHREGGGPDLAEQLRALEGVQKLCPDCKAGVSREVMRYDNPGQLEDWMYEERGVVYSYVWELYSAKGLCAPHFNPSGEEELAAEKERWSRAMAALGRYVLDHTASKST